MQVNNYLMSSNSLIKFDFNEKISNMSIAVASNIYSNLIEVLVNNQNSEQPKTCLNEFLSTSINQDKKNEFFNANLSVMNMTHLIAKKAFQEFKSDRDVIFKTFNLHSTTPSKEKIAESFINTVNRTKENLIYNLFLAESIKPAKGLHAELAAEYSSEVVNQLVKESLDKFMR